MNKVQIPEENINAYSYIFLIENALRELTIEIFTLSDGPRWYKTRLPCEILNKYKEGIANEKKVKWSQLIPHHPIYYIDFSSFNEIIRRENNWEGGFKKFFRNKESIISNLSELEFIRNKVAHNRKVSTKDLRVLEAIFNQMSKCIGTRYFTELSTKCTYGKDLLQKINDLSKEAEINFTKCINLHPLNGLKNWKEISLAWWFDESYLGFDITAIKSLFKLFEEYQSLPRTRGMGYKIEEWIHNSSIKKIFESAKKEFDVIKGAL